MMMMVMLGSATVTHAVVDGESDEDYDDVSGRGPSPWLFRMMTLRRLW